MQKYNENSTLASTKSCTNGFSNIVFYFFILYVNNQPTCVWFQFCCPLLPHFYLENFPILHQDLRAEGAPQ